jgi:predicted permease
VGAFYDLERAVVFAAVMFGGATVSALVSRFIWPKPDAAGWKLAVVATFANPIFLGALLVMGLGWKCVGGLVKDLYACLAPMMAFLAALLCLAPVCAALLWRWLKSCRASREH